MLTRRSPRSARLRAARTTAFVAFCVVEHSGDESEWIRCGRARLNRDGSLSVKLDALPRNGEVQLRPSDESSDRTSPCSSKVGSRPQRPPELDS
jgi:hypothetical protein